MSTLKPQAWSSSRAVRATGYRLQPAATSATFAARLPGQLDGLTAVGDIRNRDPRALLRQRAHDHLADAALPAGNGYDLPGVLCAHWQRGHVSAYRATAQATAQAAA
jgi:hypothetical protein